MIRAYAQLLRLPNVFTALADVWMGYLVAAASVPPDSFAPLAFLLMASGSLYSAGMVLNDVFDLEEDRRERPKRPLPSGRITRGQALTLGLGLLVAGVASAGVATYWLGWRPAAVATVLAAFVLLYDGGGKRTFLGPLLMGSCRFLNVLLGLSAIGGWPFPWMWQCAAVVGLYVVGITVFARTEAAQSRRLLLLGGAFLMIVAIGGAITLPSWFAPSVALHHDLHPYLMVVWLLIIGHPVAQAIREPTPARVQRAVKTCILGLIGLDALLAVAVVGWPGLWLLALLPPAVFLGKWVYST